MKLILSDSDTRPQWKQQLSNSIVSVHKLLAILEINPSTLNLSEQANQQFSLRVPLPFVEKMTKGDPNDPLLLQVLPVLAEEEQSPGFSLDPLQEANANPVPGLIHKYKNRVLLIGAQTCAINCRYCFRRHFPYQENRIGSKDIESIIQYITQHTELDEVILSGGDPLANNDKTLNQLISQLNNIKHLKRLRIHTRLPVVIPARINQDLINWVNQSRLPITFVIHVNHPNEVDSALADAMAKLRATGNMVLNQSVILKGINDNAKTLIRLSEKLFEAGVMPYYLNVLDRVQGSAHFEVTEAEALQLIEQMMINTSGYLVPKLVRESAEIPYKMPIK
ncbi:EF-P beta-lysylation protein EpmB [Litoribacillus peritrichatus]|uniref:L-lysine 2,3-aminomutase n=1 Tax=Litoribacillus peritrichatus TaxID=718191 RepID=A0ABP7MP56_9GAMM